MIKYDLSDRTNMFYWQTNRNVSAQEQKDIFLDRHQQVDSNVVRRVIEYGMVKAGNIEKDSKVVNLSDPIKFGSVNSVFKALLVNGREVVIRIHPGDVKNGYFWAESIAADKAVKQGVPAYKTIIVDDTRSEFDFDFMLMEALPGKTLQSFWPIDPELDKKLIRETGMYIAMIHKVNTNRFGFFNNNIARDNGRLIGQYNSFKDHFYAGLEEDLKFLTDHEVFTVAQVKSIRKIFSNQEHLLKITHPVLIHNDIADWNQLSDGKNITGIVDWDECFSGDAVMDFAQWSLFFDDSRLRYLESGYEDISNLPDGYSDKMPLFKLRYLVSKMHLRKKRAIVIADSTFLNERIKRGMEVMEELFKHYSL